MARSQGWARRGAVVVTVMMAVAALAGCAGNHLVPPDGVTTLEPAWPNWFRLEYGVDTGANGARRISGYLYNNYGEPAHDVQILTQALDPSGAIVSQRIEWLSGGMVPPLGRTYFEVRGLPAAEQYRVSVWSFTFHQSTGWF